MSKEDESAAALLSFKNGAMAVIKQEPMDADDVKVEVDDDSAMELGPTALGLLRVGEVPTRSPSQSQVVLNRRGMPARIRKRNRLFFDDDVVTSLSPRASPKRTPVVRSPKKVQPVKASSAPSKPSKESIETRRQNMERTRERSTTPTRTLPIIPKIALKQEPMDHPSSSPDKKFCQKIGMRLRNLLKLPKAHKWVCYEWFYSNIDKTLFEGDNDFMICLKESFPQLQTRKLTRVEWCKMRRMMGKPRRCSVAFFDEERRELEAKRSKIRLLQQRKLTDVSQCRDLPEEIPLQLVIGTRVTARLRKPQDGLFTGSIDAVDTSNNTYRITFERPGLGTHSVPDYEVLSTETPEMISVSSFAQKFRPRQSQAASGTGSVLSGSLSVSFAACGEHVPQRGMMNGLPVKLLETLVRLHKILNVKKIRIKALRSMNAEAEKKKSFGQPITEVFQRQYASTIIDLERINTDLHHYLKILQVLCQEIAPDPSTAALFIPSHLRDRSREDAKKLVDKSSNSVQNSRVIDLITDLTSLMLQVKGLTDGDYSPYELKVVQGSMEQIRSRLSAGNQQLFQNNVEIHLQHIQMGLGQRGVFTPFMSQRA